VTSACGVAFTHDVAVTGQYAYPEIIGAGAALLDADGDGDLDIYAVQGGPLPGSGSPAQSGRLLMNDGAGRFRDATEEAGITAIGFGMGAWPADVDNDGDEDLFLTNVGANALLVNDGTGKFTDVSAGSGLEADPSFSLGAAFFDLNADGLLDLFVANYVQWEPGRDPTCFTHAGGRDYCGPSMYRGAPDRLYLNLGAGRFRDVTEERGINDRDGRGMGVLATDLDDDGHLDLYVTNDGQANDYWRGRADGNFANESLMAGCAVSGDGKPEASMGIACEDLDGDFDLDLYMTHLVGETHTAYRNERGTFDDHTDQFGLGSWNRTDTGFGIAFFDLDNDGRRDLYVANGAVMLPTRPVDPALPYALRNRLVRQVARGKYEDITSAAGAALGPVEMSRGVCAGDVDGDGRVDLVVANNRGPLRVLRNTAQPAHWVGIRPRWPVGATPPSGGRSVPSRAAIGAIVRLIRTDAPERVVIAQQRLLPHQGYLSTHEPVIRFGRGTQEEPVDIEIRWADGSVDRWDDLAPDCVHDLFARTGRPVP